MIEGSQISAAEFILKSREGLDACIGPRIDQPPACLFSTAEDGIR